VCESPIIREDKVEEAPIESVVEPEPEIAIEKEEVFQEATI
jgi:hypothetical protein